MVDVLFNNEQFFMIILFILWLVTIMLAEEKEDSILYGIQFVIHMPLMLIMVSNAYLQGIPYGYIGGFGITLISSYYTWYGVSKYYRKKKELKGGE